MHKKFSLVPCLHLMFGVCLNLHFVYDELYLPHRVHYLPIFILPSWTHTRIHTHGYARTHACTHMHAHTHIHTSIMHACMHTHTFSHTHTFTHTHTHIYTRTYTHRCTVLHGGKQQDQREISIKGFREDTFNILIATDVAGRGIDVPDVALVRVCVVSLVSVWVCACQLIPGASFSYTMLVSEALVDNCM
jgi:late competence protein required for DNA uptake (superfamily II DNA/RNA helicase)